MTDQSILKNELKAQWEAMAEDWISQVQDGETSQPRGHARRVDAPTPLGTYRSAR